MRKAFQQVIVAPRSEAGLPLFLARKGPGGKAEIQLPEFRIDTQADTLDLAVRSAECLRGLGLPVNPEDLVLLESTFHRFSGCAMSYRVLNIKIARPLHLVSVTTDTDSAHLEHTPVWSEFSCPEKLEISFLGKLTEIVWLAAVERLTFPPRRNIRLWVKHPRRDSYGDLLFA